MERGIHPEGTQKSQCGGPHPTLWSSRDPCGLKSALQTPINLLRGVSPAESGSGTAGETPAARSGYPENRLGEPSRCRHRPGIRSARGGDASRALPQEPVFMRRGGPRGWGIHGKKSLWGSFRQLLPVRPHSGGLRLRTGQCTRWLTGGTYLRVPDRRRQAPEGSPRTPRPRRLSYATRIQRWAFISKRGKAPGATAVTGIRRL